MIQEKAIKNFDNQRGFAVGLSGVCTMLVMAITLALIFDVILVIAIGILCSIILLFAVLFVEISRTPTHVTIYRDGLTMNFCIGKSKSFSHEEIDSIYPGDRSNERDHPDVLFKSSKYPYHISHEIKDALYQSYYDKFAKYPSKRKLRDPSESIGISFK